MPSVLVIDDASGALESLGRALRDAGFEVAWARTGRDGLDLARQRTIDLILATLQPSDGTDIDALRQLRGESAAIPFVIVTDAADHLLDVVRSLVRPPLSRGRSAAAGSVNRLNHQAIAAVALIEERYGNPELTVRTAARDLGISTEHLCRLLKRHTGCTFVSILRGARVRAARQLLRTTNLSMKQIADRAGFSSASRFDRDFKNVSGIPPTEYRVSGGRRSQRVIPR
jgi:AraC-like DNA-binding protein